MRTHTDRIRFCLAALLVTATAATCSRTLEPPEVRAALFAEVQPVKLTNCEMARFGESNDGGYLACANLLGGVKSAYSYGIAGYDGWGCDISRRLNVTTHQYDYFPSWAFEVLFINKSIGIVDRARRPQLPNPLDTPSDLSRVDCQAPLR